MRPCFSQQLPPNIKKVEVVDVDDDGLNEILVTLTDRVVRTYQWRSFAEFSENVDENNAKEEEEDEEQQSKYIFNLTNFLKYFEFHENRI